MSDTPRPDPVTAARDALLADVREFVVHGVKDRFGTSTALSWHVAERLDNLIALARAEAGVPVGALHRDHHPVPYHWSQSGERGTVCAGSLVGLHHRVELWPCDVERAIQTALAARSAGSGARVERCEYPHQFGADGRSLCPRHELCGAPSGTYDGIEGGRPWCVTPCPHDPARPTPTPPDAR